MEEMIKTISEENNKFKEYKEKYIKLKENNKILNNSNEEIFIRNEKYLTDITFLKNEIECLKQEFNSQRKKLESNLNNKKFQEKLRYMIEQNNNEIMIIMWSIMEEKNKKYKNIFEA